MVNLTPTQPEEFESTFQYFDKDETNTIHIAELIAALTILGIVYLEEDMERLPLRRLFIFWCLLFFLSETNSQLIYSLFFRVEIMEGQRSPEQLREGFRGITRLCLRAFRFNDRAWTPARNPQPLDQVFASQDNSSCC